jgi:L-histidine N-alpha-methyltransferase
VNIAGTSVLFKDGEWIYMEISQKYSVEDIEKMAEASGFKSSHQLSDSKQWFVDAIWTAF